MKITINLDNLDEAISQLNTLQEKLKTFGKDWGDEVAQGIKYPTTVKSTEKNINITSTHPHIAFLEYGAGFIADETVIGIEGQGGIDTFPGAWSEDDSVGGKHTFSAWQESGKPESQYPYNQAPRRYMRNAVDRLLDHTEEKAAEYFK